MTDYKNTLNLPKTDFPMKANLPAREPGILAYWEEIRLYQQLRDVGASRTKFILHDGPPYANGQIHLGHAINKTLKDIIIRSKTLGNFDAPYVPGWDCHGLPIELNVEKNIVKSTQVTAKEFIKACRDYANSQIELQKASFIRLGVLGDWQNPYRTMDPQYEANIIRSLSKIIANGHLQQGHKPVHWCTECGSALAEAEVEYKDKDSFAIDVLFRVVDGQEVVKRLGLQLADAEIAVPIWTTTPWTLPANQAVALNPTHDYVILEVLNKISPLLIVAKELLDSFAARCEISEYQIVANFQGQDLAGIRLHHPFLMREVPLVMSDHVTLDAGTGAVHIAPAHGQEDYIVGVNNKLPIDNPVDGKGIFVAGTPFFAGEHVFKVNPHVISVIQEAQNLLHENKIRHSYAHCWRHKTPLIYRATPQWFISMEKNGLREASLEAIKGTKWIPDWGQNRIADMIQKRPDWCISRQRIWNTPIVLFVHKHTGELHPDTLALMEKVALEVEQKGIEAWYELAAQDLLGSEADQYDKITDTLDVWFDAGTSHECVLNQRPDLHTPADLYLEGSDQHRGWFQTSLLTSVAMYGRAPFFTVLTHGFTVDAEGRKMSKSLGNVIAPEQVINKLGADVLRLWVANTDYRGEMTVADEIFERSAEAYRRIRNTVRFFLSNLDDFDIEKNKIAFDDMLQLDQWAVDTATQLQEEIIVAYDAYQFHQVSQKIHNFCTVEMGSFYLDILKDRLYTMKADSHARRSAQSAIYHLLQAMVRWIAPILCFTAEEIWQHIPNQSAKSVFLTTWYPDLGNISEDSRESWRKIMSIRERVNHELENQRKQGVIGSPLAAKVSLYCDEQLHTLLQRFGEELRFILITSDADVYPLDHYKGEPDLGINEVNSQDEFKMQIVVEPSTDPKCQRCWHRRPDVGSDVDHPEICGRCVINVFGDGEKRLFA
jgi:isoleucyl-tRNA synthetase